MDSDNPSIDFSQYQSFVYLVLANAVIFLAIYTPKTYRPILLLPTWFFFGLSFMTLHLIPIPRPLLSNIGLYVTIASLLWPIGLFTTEPLKITTIKTVPAGPDSKSQPPTTICHIWNLRAAYRLYNNPRKLSPPPPSITNHKPTLPQFTLYRLTQILLLSLLHITLLLLCTTILSHAQPSDFTPAREPLLSIRDGWDLAIRLAVLVYWIAQGAIPLQIVHYILSIIFVVVLRVDGTDEWPALFGWPWEAWSLRRYWGIFWHRLFSGGAVVWARGVVRMAMGARRVGRGVEGAVVAFVVFLVSGLAHAAVGWRLGYCCLDRDVKFFMWNFAGILGEVVVLSGLRVVGRWVGGRIGMKTESTGFVWRCGKGLGMIGAKLVGYLWVLTFFLWAMPPYLYPKGYDSMRRTGLVVEPEGLRIGAAGW